MISNCNSLYYDKINRHIVIAEEMDNIDKLYDRQRFIAIGIAVSVSEKDIIVLSPYFIKYSINLTVATEAKLKKHIIEYRNKYINEDLLNKINENDLSIVDSTDSLISYVANNAENISNKLSNMSKYMGISDLSGIFNNEFISYDDSDKSDLSFVFGGFGSYISALNRPEIEKYQEAYQHQTEINVYSAEDFFNVSTSPVYYSTSDEDDSDDIETADCVELKTITFNELKKQYKHIQLFEFFGPTFLKINIL
jgi:hypothetical protein